MKKLKWVCLTGCIALLLGGGVLARAQPTVAGAPVAGDQSGQRITLSFRESSIREVFEVLSRKDRVNIVLGKGVTGAVSVNLYDVTVKDAIYRVAEAAGYAVELVGNDYLIVDRKETGQEHPGALTELHAFKVQYSDPKQVAEILTKYLSRYGKITALNERQMIVVDDKPEFVARIAKLLTQLDSQPKQVLIEAKVLEITLDDGETYGVDWSHIFGTPGSVSTNGSLGTNGLATGSVAGGPSQSGFFFSLANRNLNLFLEAKATKNRVRTLSTPKLLAMENREAKAVIGNSTGYKVTTTINQVTTESIQFLESGVILRVTPSVDQQGRVLLKVHPEVSLATLNDGVPAKKSTEVTTELLCEDGQSVFIGGLIKSGTNQGKTGVPVLGDLPGIGRLFSTTSDTVNSTETVVIITPHIIQDPRSASALSQPEVQRIDDANARIAAQQLKMDYSLSNELPAVAPIH